MRGMRGISKIVILLFALAFVALIWKHYADGVASLKSALLQTAIVVIPLVLLGPIAELGRRAGRAIHQRHK
jgi:hypothetical protein